MIIRTLSPSREIYPSIIMPGGASLLRTSDDELIFKKILLYGISKETGDHVPLDQLRLIAPAPIQYLGDMRKNNFGLDGPTESVAQTKQWWRSKMKDQNCVDSVVIIKYFDVSIPSMRESVTEEEYVGFY